MHLPQLKVTTEVVSSSLCVQSLKSNWIVCAIIRSPYQWLNSAGKELYLLFKTSEHRTYVSVCLFLDTPPSARTCLDKCKLPWEKNICQQCFKLHVCVVAKHPIQVNAHFCLYFSLFLCRAGCILKNEFYADLNNIISYFPAMLKFAAAQNCFYFHTTERKVVTSPSTVVLTPQFSWWSQHYIYTILENVLNSSLQKKKYTYIARNVMKPKHLLSKTTKIKEKFIQNLFSSSVFKNEQKSSCTAQTKCLLWQWPNTDALGRIQSKGKHIWRILQNNQKCACHSQKKKKGNNCLHAYIYLGGVKKTAKS